MRKNNVTIDAGVLLGALELQPAGLFPWDVVALPGGSVDETTLFSPSKGANSTEIEESIRPQGTPSLKDVPGNRVILVATMHCGKSLRGSKEDKNCWLTCLEASFRGEKKPKVSWQHAVPLPSNLDHVNMMCSDL